MPRTLLYGLVLFDLIEGEKYIGGPAINIALHMACQGYFPTLVSCVGNDELGGIAKQLLEKNKISTKYLVEDQEHETGWVKVCLDRDGNPSFEIVKPVAYDYIKLSAEQLASLSQEAFDIFYFGTVVQRNKTSQKTLQKLILNVTKKEVFFDINLRTGHYSKDIVDFSLEHTDILKLNDEELIQVKELFGLNSRKDEQLITWLFNRYKIRTILMTRGEKGVSVFTRDGRKDIEGIKVKVKDTVGSGDAFSAGFIMEYLSCGDLIRAAVKGNELGAYVATKTGAVPELDEKSPTLLNYKFGLEN